jgi:hypothetical protein
MGDCLDTEEDWDDYGHFNEYPIVPAPNTPYAVQSQRGVFDNRVAKKTYNLNAPPPVQNQYTQQPPQRQDGDDVEVPDRPDFPNQNNPFNQPKSHFNGSQAAPFMVKQQKITISHLLNGKQWRLVTQLYLKKPENLYAHPDRVFIVPVVYKTNNSIVTFDFVDSRSIDKFNLLTKEYEYFTVRVTTDDPISRKAVYTFPMVYKTSHVYNILETPNKEGLKFTDVNGIKVHANYQEMKLHKHAPNVAIKFLMTPEHRVYALRYSLDESFIYGAFGLENE